MCVYIYICIVCLCILLVIECCRYVVCVLLISVVIGSWCQRPQSVQDKKKHANVCPVILFTCDMCCVCSCVGVLVSVVELLCVISTLMFIGSWCPRPQSVQDAKRHGICMGS